MVPWMANGLITVVYLGVLLPCGSAPGRATLIVQGPARVVPVELWVMGPPLVLALAVVFWEGSVSARSRIVGPFVITALAAALWTAAWGLAWPASRPTGPQLRPLGVAAMLALAAFAGWAAAELRRRPPGAGAAPGAGQR